MTDSIRKLKPSTVHGVRERDYACAQYTGRLGWLTSRQPVHSLPKPDLSTSLWDKVRLKSSRKVFWVSVRLLVKCPASP